MSQKVAGDTIFGESIIPSSQIFLIRKNVFATVNRKPTV